MRVSLRFSDWPLRVKMALLLVAASLLPLVLSTYLDLQRSRERQLQAMQALLQARGDQIARELDGFHRGYRQAGERLARFPDSKAFCVAGAAQRDALRAAVRGLLDTYPGSDDGIRDAGLIGADGRVMIATDERIVGIDLSNRPNMRDALAGRAVVTDPYVSPSQSGGVPTIAYLTPIGAADGRVVGVAALWVRAAAFWRFVRASDALAGPGSFAVLLDGMGIRIAHTNNNDIVFHPAAPLEPTLLEALVAQNRFGTRTRALLEDVRPFPELFERARTAAPDAAVFRALAPLSATWSYAVARRLDSVHWTVFYAVPETPLLAEIARATRERLALAALIIAAAIGLGLAVAAGSLRPIRSLRRASAAIAAGDLAARVSGPRGDELGRLGADFNAMAERIEQQAKNLQRSRDELEQRVLQRTAELGVEIAERMQAERGLRERDAALQRAHAMSKLAHVVTRGDGSFESWSETLPPLIGVAADAMPRSTREWLKRLHPEDRERFRAVSLAAAASGARQDLQYRLRRGDDTWVQLRQAIEPIAGQPGAAGKMRWFSTLQDVSAQHAVEQQLRASEERLRSIVDTALDAVVTMDAAGTITGWNPQAEATFGWTREEAIGRALADTIVPPAQREAHRRGLARYLAGGEAAVLNRRIEIHALHRSGREFPVDLSITPLRTRDAVGFSAFVRDITERKSAQARLQAQLERLQLLDQITAAIGQRQDLRSIYQVAIRSLEERLPVDFGCICRFDPDANVLIVAHVGVGGAAAVADLDLGEHTRIDVDPNGLARCLRGELVYEPDVAAIPFAFPQRLARAGLRSLVIAPLQSESRVFGIVVVARVQAEAFASADCEFLRQLSAHVALAARQAELHGALQEAYDELRRTQQNVMQQERLRALGQMASGVAHDINNAISPVALYVENLLERESGLSERARGYMVTIARAIDDVAATVARMREFYRPREPQLALLPVQLNRLIPQVVDLTRARWSDMPQQRGAVIELKQDLRPDLPPLPGVDSELREALTNLVLNAVDAMPDGGTLTLRTRLSEGDGATAVRVVVEVGDSGVGMSEDTRRRCMEPFFTTKGERGTGLGLAMVYGVVQRHGGEIHVDSAPGQGTTVRLGFPVAARARAAHEVPDPGPPAPGARLRVLVVDDDPLLLRSLTDILEADGHSVVTAAGGQAGIDAFIEAQRSGRTFDAVITDLGMPYVDGRKVAQAVKAAAAATRVIMLTGWGQRLMTEPAGPPEHVDRVLGKPPKLAELRAALTPLAPGATITP